MVNVVMVESIELLFLILFPVFLSYPGFLPGEIIHAGIQIRYDSQTRPKLSDFPNQGGFFPDFGIFYAAGRMLPKIGFAGKAGPLGNNNGG